MVKGAAAPRLVAVQGMAAKAHAGGRGLYENEDQGRPGRSELAYMQHKYTPLDSRIIIITAAILLLLLSILFLNFFIRWALRRFFLLRSQKPINPNKGLTKRQVQALPSFIYSSSKPPMFASPPIATPPYNHPNFFHALFPFTCHGDALKPIPSHFSHAPHPTNVAPTKIDNIDNHPPTTFEVDKGVHTPSSQLRDNNSPSPLGSTNVHEVDSNPPTKFGSLEVDQVLGGSNPPIEANEVVLTILSDAKASDPTIDCTKANEMTNHGDENASSVAPCPICLVDFADGDTIRVLPTCQHYFHIGCIDLWLAKSSSCPACRANLWEATRTLAKQPTLQVQVVIATSH